MPSDHDRPIDTANRFLVGGSADGHRIVIVGLPSLRPHLTHEHALTLAAWLVAMVGDRERFDRILDAILKG
jgi:hypothetical protein